LPAITLLGATDLISEGDRVEVDLDSATLRNTTHNEVHRFDPFPEFIRQTLRAGGLVAQLENAGHLRPRP